MTPAQRRRAYRWLQSLRAPPKPKPPPKPPKPAARLEDQPLFRGRPLR